MRILPGLWVALLTLTLFPVIGTADESKSDAPLVIVVMDPLAKPLSCPCVAGYAQRDYEKLGVALHGLLGREVKVIFNESLVAAQKTNDLTHVDLVIGKQSVILHDAKAAHLSLKKVAMLTGKDGLTTQRGLVVVPTADPAKKISDLKDYRIYFGPRECDEKHAAALRLLKEQGVIIPETLETAVACDEGAVKILELGEKGLRGAAVISSYAKPLLEGCGQVPKGSLRVLGETEEIPFIAVYLNSSLESGLQSALIEGVLKSTVADVPLRIALETKRGFIVEDDTERDIAKKK
jgi:ABC-type phosphate/phosphonate transport system substrate-binding protein